MPRSSINFQKAKLHFEKHNFRIDEPSYLLPSDFRKQNFGWKLSKSAKEIFDEQVAKANRKGGRIPRFENSLWEGILNLESHHKLDDVLKVAKHIEKVFGILCVHVAIHNDEGWVDKNNKPHYNHHAHLVFLTYYKGKQRWRRQYVTRAKLSQLQTDVAEILGLERGEINTKRVRLEHGQYKIIAKAYYRYKLFYQKKLKEKEDEILRLKQIEEEYKKSLELLRQKDDEILQLKKQLEDKKESNFFDDFFNEQKTMSKKSKFSL